MDPNELNGNQGEDFEAEDSLPEEIAEEEQDESQDLAEVMGEGDQQGQNGQQAQEGTTEPKEPGYVQRRISKAVEKALADQAAAFEAQMAPMREYMMNQEAQELVRSGKVKDLETAKELVRYRQGQPQQAAPAQQAEQPRNAQGQFTSRQAQAQPTSDPATQARIDMLQHQADRIKAGNGPDVIAEFKNNKDIQQKVINGDMDFYDVAEQMRQPARRKPPAPMRSPNGASGMNPNAIDTMSDEQFDRMEKNIKKGARYSLR